MQNLALIGGLIGLLVHIPLLQLIYKDPNTKQSFASYFLWGILDVIAVITTINQGGNYWLPLFYSIGAFSVAILLFKKKKFSWKSFEWKVSLAILAILIIWFFVGNKIALTATVVALTIASFPQIKETWLKPSETPTWIYAVFCVANLLSFIGGKTWTVEEKLYSGGALLLCLIIGVLSARKDP